MTEPTKPRRMTPAQAETARQILASPDKMLRYYGGVWSTTPEMVKPLDDRWETTVQNVRTMTTNGWLEFTGLDPAHAWADPRRLTEAGKDALADFDARRAKR